MKIDRLQTDEQDIRWRVNAYSELVGANDVDRMFTKAIELHCRMHPNMDPDRKKNLSRQKTLKSRHARHILTIVWRESGSFGEKELKMLGITPIFNGKPYNKRELALRLLGMEHSEDSDAAAANLARVTAQIGTVLDAAEAYRLVLIEKEHTTKSQISGTDRLDDMMINFSRSLGGNTG
jgi:hypothetical protein